MKNIFLQILWLLNASPDMLPEMPIMDLLIPVAEAEDKRSPINTSLSQQFQEEINTFVVQDLKQEFAFLVAQKDQICEVEIQPACYEGTPEKQVKKDGRCIWEELVTLPPLYFGVCWSLTGKVSCTLKEVQEVLETREIETGEKYFEPTQEKCLLISDEEGADEMKAQSEFSGFPAYYGICTVNALRKYQSERCALEPKPSFLYQTVIYNENYEAHLKTMIALVYEIDESFKKRILPNFCSVLHKKQKISEKISICNQYEQ